MDTYCFWSKRLYNPFTKNIGLEVQFESRDDGSDTKDDRTTNTNIKEGGNYGNGQVAGPDVETTDLQEEDALQGFVSYGDEEDITLIFLIF